MDSQPSTEDNSPSTEEAPPTNSDIEKKEEAKLKAKYPMTAARGHSAFLLQKKLTKGQKFFDSGDYQMAKQSNDPSKKLFPPPLNPASIAIPTPETVPARKTSIIQPKFHLPPPT
ncbi:cAMP-regulated phosphoprotein/endosulfine conserved region [Nesidiocoris tenuis]|nr:cAMP-regulated phosphoprotein/endosulfine conserved region [Nesidiocoris tenuis]